ncbi:MAG: LicD family protein [Bacteroides sp.]|nr:LicD family protein [Prevotella sp.]MCM1408278.1 LicD family protein [Treponema brennaborense]MCM1470490.1 LicD family protein [Bacteroides sp.]
MKVRKTENLVPLPPNELRKAQFLMLKILKEVHRICEENGIHYFLSDGTLIGAIRHNGFIPWDDDIDISMLRSDYETFCKIASEKLGEEYILQTGDTDPGYGLYFVKVMLKNTHWLESDASDTNRSVSGIYIDIFPFDKIPEDRKKWRQLQCRFRLLDSIIKIKTGYYNIDSVHGIFHKSYYCLKKLLGTLIPLKCFVSKRKKLCMKYETLSSSFLVARYQVFARRGETEKDVNKIEHFTSLVLHDFEDAQFYIPQKYDVVLKQYYGDYMTLPPVEKQKNHGIVEYDFGGYL